VEIVKLLLQNGADMHIADSHGVSALDLALSFREEGYGDSNKEILRLLREFDTKGR
jgi:ankyrin repeat protein